MADMMADGCSWLVGQLSTNVSQTVTLKRGGKATPGVKATKCPPNKQRDPTQNIDTLDVDWIIKTSLYKINGAVVDPQKNDVIEETNGQQFSALPLTDMENESRPFDAYGNAWRIHTKRVKAD